MSPPGNGLGAVEWLRGLCTNQTDGDVLLLTAEQMHLICMLAGVSSVPGLGPLPIDAGRSEERLMRSTALRAVAAWGGVELDGRVATLHPRLKQFFQLLGGFQVAVRAVRAEPDRSSARVWAGWHGGAASLTPVTLSDYRLERLERDRLVDDLFRFLGPTPAAPVAAVGRGVESRRRSAADRSVEVAGALRTGVRIGLSIVRSGEQRDMARVRLLTDGHGRWWQIHVADEEEGDLARTAVSELSEGEVRASVAALLNGDG